MPSSCFFLPNLAAASIDLVPASCPLLVFAMAPKPRKKKVKPRSPACPPPALEPALEQSTMINKEGLDKDRHVLAASSDEGGRWLLALRLGEPER